LLAWNFNNRLALDKVVAFCDTTRFIPVKGMRSARRTRGG
jgi:hypothetical protein